jgi:hypothetical protein
MKYYIAGPMTGIPQFNYPLFDKVAEHLKKEGYDVVSPAEMDSPETRAVAMASPDGRLSSGVCNGETWGDFLSRDVKLIADSIDAIVLLPRWFKSRGARLECFVAMNKNIPAYEYEEGILAGPLNYEWLFKHIQQETLI